MNGSKCEKEEVVDAYYERICATNYSMSTTGRCINYNKTANKQDGYVCENESSKLIDKTCIIYDIVEAKGR